MTEVRQVYVCDVCGNVVEVLHAGRGTLVCCGKPMRLLEAKARGAGEEKHVPVIERSPTGVRVRVGSVPHPMEEGHYVVWIEVSADGKVYRALLRPGEEPVAEFPITAERVEAREYCNLHGLWRSEA